MGLALSNSCNGRRRYPISLLRQGIVTLALLIGSGSAHAWPDRIVRIVTPTGAGGGSDTIARTFADKFSKRWGQAVVVENKPGADGLLAVADFLSARDGHTILFGFTSIVTVNPLLHDKLPYDPLRDIVPISPAVDDSIAVAASPSLGVNSLSELVDLARNKPNTLNYASVPGGGHFGIVDFQRTTGIAMTFVPYRNPIASITDLMEGRIQIAIMPLSIVLSHALAGKLKLLAVASDKRAPAAPDVPTTAEVGAPRFRGLGGLGFFGPKDMPAAQRDFIAEEIAAIVSEPQIQERMINLGYSPRSAGPKEFEKMLTEQSAWYKSIAPERDK